MNLVEALNQLPNRCKISRKSWKDGRYLVYVEKQVIKLEEINRSIRKYIEDEIFGIGGIDSYTIDAYIQLVIPSELRICYRWFPLDEDAEADDYYILEDGKHEKSNNN